MESMMTMSCRLNWSAKTHLPAPMEATIRFATVFRRSQHEMEMSSASRLCEGPALPMTPSITPPSVQPSMPCSTDLSSARAAPVAW